MARRRLGGDPSLLVLMKGIRRQQVLLQLSIDHCGNEEGDYLRPDLPL